MVNHYKTELFDGLLEYHTYSAKNWFGIGGVSHPLFKTLISRINSEVEDVKYFDLYVVGGILEDWVSWDIDFAVIGKYQPQRVYNVFDLLGFLHDRLRPFQLLHLLEWLLHMQLILHLLRLE